MNLQPQTVYVPVEVEKRTPNITPTSHEFIVTKNGYKKVLHSSVIKNDRYCDIWLEQRENVISMTPQELFQLMKDVVNWITPGYERSVKCDVETFLKSKGILL